MHLFVVAESIALFIIWVLGGMRMKGGWKQKSERDLLAFWDSLHNGVSEHLEKREGSIILHNALVL